MRFSDWVRQWLAEREKRKMFPIAESIAKNARQVLDRVLDRAPKMGFWMQKEETLDALCIKGFGLAPPVGLEPTTLRLTAACSTN